MPAMSTNRRKRQARQRAALLRAARQVRRERAAELFAQGRTQAEVARRLDVSRQSASRWHTRWQADGTTALRTRGPTGRRPKVADEQLEAIQQALLEGALAHGFATDVWTLDGTVASGDHRRRRPPPGPLNAAFATRD
jgi:transposase